MVEGSGAKHEVGVECQRSNPMSMVLERIDRTALESMKSINTLAQYFGDQRHKPVQHPRF